MNLLPQLLVLLKLFTWSATFYFTHPVLIAISIVPAAIRAIQMLYRQYLASPMCEAIVGISRAVLVFAIIGMSERGGLGAFLSGERLYDSFILLKTRWPETFLQIILFGALFGLINLSLALLVRVLGRSQVGSNVEAAQGRQNSVGKAILFIVKNTLVIPLGLIYLLRALEIL